MPHIAFDPDQVAITPDAAGVEFSVIEMGVGAGSCAEPFITCLQWACSSGGKNTTCSGFFCRL